MRTNRQISIILVGFQLKFVGLRISCITYISTFIVVFFGFLNKKHKYFFAFLYLHLDSVLSLKDLFSISTFLW